MRITMIGHSTVLIEAADVRLLTDPYFGSFGNPAFRRLAPPAVEAAEIGNLDGVLVSHAHWDHTDRQFFRRLDAAVPVMAPFGTALIFKLKGARSIVPMRPWQTFRLSGAVVTAVPAKHVARTVGFVVEVENRCIYFAGDTYYRPFMARIGDRFRIDIALIPVTTFRIAMTMGERGAVSAARDLRAATIIPIHLGLRPRLPLLRTRQSPEGFAARLHNAGIAAEVVVLDNGESIEA